MSATRVIPMVALVAALVAFLAAPSWAQSGADGPEIAVNTYTASEQSQPVIGMAADGRFVVVWTSAGQDGDGFGVYGQRFDAAGAPQAAEFRVNTTTAKRQWQPAVGMAADGRFVVLWTGDAQEGDGSSIYSQYFGADGTPLEAEGILSQSPSGRQREPAIGMAPDGRFVVAWTDNGLDGDNDGVFAVLYDADRQPLGPAFQVNTTSVGVQGQPTVGMAADGRFVIAWSSAGQEGAASTMADTSNVYARGFDPSGIPWSDEFRVNATTASIQWQPAVGMAADGRYVIAWTSTNQDGDADGVYAQLYDLDGMLRGSEFRVNTTTANWQHQPDVGMAPDGRFIVAWTSDGQDGSGDGIYAQPYAADGTPLTQEARMNITIARNQRGPSVAAGRGEHIVIAWTSNSGGTADVVARQISLSAPLSASMPATH